MSCKENLCSTTSDVAWMRCVCRMYCAAHPAIFKCRVHGKHVTMRIQWVWCYYIFIMKTDWATFPNRNSFSKITAYKGTCVLFTVQKTNKFVVFLSAPVEDGGAREIQIWYELLNKGVWDWRKRPNNGDNRRDQQNVWYFGCYITYYYKWNRNGRGCRRTGTDKLDNFWRWTFGYVMRCCVRSSRTVNDILHALNFN